MYISLLQEQLVKYLPLLEMEFYLKYKLFVEMILEIRYPSRHQGLHIHVGMSLDHTVPRDQ